MSQAVAECPQCGARSFVDPTKPMPPCWRCLDDRKAIKTQETIDLIETKLASLADVDWPVRTEAGRENCRGLADVILRDMRDHGSLRCNASRRRLADLWRMDQRQVSRTLPAVMAVPGLFSWMSKGHAWSKEWPNGKRATIFLRRP